MITVRSLSKPIRNFIFAGIILSLVLATIALLPQQARATVPGENGRIAFQRNINGELSLWTANPDGSEELRLTPEGLTIQYPQWSPDGTKLAFNGYNGTSWAIYTINADGSGLTTLVAQTPQRFAVNPSWSPDGTKIVFNGSLNFSPNPPTGEDLYIINADGTNEMLLYAGPRAETFPSWSPDGTKIAVSSRHLSGFTDYQLVLVNADGSGATTIDSWFTNNAISSGPDWSPDGTRLVYHDTTTTIVINADGTNRRVASYNLRLPEFSPDGTRIIGSSQLSGVQDIASIDSNTLGGLTLHIATPAIEHSASWQPLPPSDTTAPTVTFNTPSQGASYTLNSTILADYSCADEAGGSGLASCVGTVANGAAIDAASVGQKSLSVTASDVQGNSKTYVVTYNVTYSFGGITGPVDGLPVLNKISAGRSVPVKFSLGGDRGLNIFASGYPRSEQIPCNSTAPVDGVEETSTVNTGLKYDVASGTYSYNWKTEKSWAGTCRQFVIVLNDGTSWRANFSFVK